MTSFVPRQSGELEFATFTLRRPIGLDIPVGSDPIDALCKLQTSLERVTGQLEDGELFHSLMQIHTLLDRIIAACPATNAHGIIAKAQREAISSFDNTSLFDSAGSVIESESLPRELDGQLLASLILDLQEQVESQASYRRRHDREAV